MYCLNCKTDLQKYITDWIYKCNKCGLYKSLLFDKNYNGEDPIGWTESASDFLERLRQDNAVIILKELSNHTTLEGKQLLDIGCAAGWFLSIAEQYNLIATGLEPEENIANKGIKKLIY